MRFCLNPLRCGVLIAALLWTGVLRAEFDLIRAPEFYRQSLLNGMQILFLPGDASRTPFVLMIQNGAAFDPTGKGGLTYLTTLMLTRQSQNRDGLAFETALQKLGAELKFRVTWDAIFLYGSAPSSRVIDVLNLLGAAVARPDFPQQAFDNLRQELIGQVSQQQKSLPVLTQEHLLGALFPPNPYAHPVMGTVETLSSLTLIDVKRQYRKTFLPNQAQLAFFYGEDRGKGFGELSQNWGMWVRREALPFTFRPADPPPGIHIVLLDRPGDKSMFRWGTLGPEAASRDLLPLKVLEQYVTLSLPDWAREISSEDQIRASSRIEVNRMPGYFQLSIQTRPEHLVPYFKMLMARVADLHGGRLDMERFQEAKRLVYLEFRQSLEDPEARLYRLMETDLYRWGVNFIVYFGLRVDRVTPEVFREAVSSYLPLDRFVLVVAGVASEIGPDLELLGEVNLVP